MNHPAGGRHLDLDLFRVFGVAEAEQGLAAARADTLLGRQFEEFLADGQMGVIAARGAGVLWLLTPLPLGSLKVVPRIIEVMGAIVVNGPESLRG